MMGLNNKLDRKDNEIRLLQPRIDLTESNNKNILKSKEDVISKLSLEVKDKQKIIEMYQ